MALPFMPGRAQASNAARTFRGWGKHIGKYLVRQRSYPDPFAVVNGGHDGSAASLGKSESALPERIASSAAGEKPALRTVPTGSRSAGGKRRVNRTGRTDHEERIPVGGRTHNRLGSDVAVRPRPVLDNELLTEPFRQPLTYRARGDVSSSARGIAHDDAHWPGWIGLCSYCAGDSRQRDSAGSEMQDFAAVKFHCVPPKANRTLMLPDDRISAGQSPKGSIS